MSRQVTAEAPEGALPGLAHIWPPADGRYDHSPVTAQVLHAASRRDYDGWWSQVAAVGFCARPVHLTGRTPEGRTFSAMARCKNRRAESCPSCSALYSGDTWHLVHAGTAGDDTLGIPDTIGDRTMVFATLTAPGFGAVHTSHRHRDDRTCHRDRRRRRCRHGKLLGCTSKHDRDDELVGQPLCADCYDYHGHVEFTWNAPALWHRFTIGLRRLVARRLRQVGADPASVRVNYVKVVELQARAIPHFHTLIRLDPTDSDAAAADTAAPITAGDLAALTVQAATAARLTIADTGRAHTLRFGTQIDAQPINARHENPNSRTAESQRWSARRVAAYLAKYVTKSVTDFGLSPHHMSPAAIETIAVTEHVRAILRTIAVLAENPTRRIMLTRLHCLGYRGHITTKTRQYSTTMTALRARRRVWQAAHQPGRPPEGDEAGGVPTTPPSDPADSTTWRVDNCGHATTGQRLLAVTAALHHLERRRAARDAVRHGDPPGSEPR